MSCPDFYQNDEIFKDLIQTIGLYPHFTKDYFGPDSTRSLYMVDRPHIWESNWGLADNHGQSPGKVGEGRGRSGAIASVLRESGTEKVIGYFFKRVQKQ